MRGRACAVCIHPKLRQIEDTLSAGGKLVATAQQFGVSKSGLARHRTNCLAPKVAAAARLTQGTKAAKAPIVRARQIASGASAPTPQEALSLTALLERMERSLSRLEKSADAASADNLHTALAAVSGQISRSVETAARLQNIGYKDAGQPQGNERFSVSIIIPDTATQPVTIDCTPESGSEASDDAAPLHKVTARRNFAIGFDLDAAPERSED